MQPDIFKRDGRPIPGAVRVFEDSYYVPQFLDVSSSAALFDGLTGAHVLWVRPSDLDMKYRGRELKREKCFWIRSLEPTPDPNAPPKLIIKYGYPGFQYGSTRYYRPFEASPAVKAIRDYIAEHCTFNEEPIFVNHCIGTRYRNGEDNIGYHSDKLKDFVPNTPIVSISLGEAREFHFGRPDPKNPKNTIFERAFWLQQGDLFVLGPITNELHRHAIVPIVEERLRMRTAGVPIGPRISLVMRNIRTVTPLAVAQKKARATERRRIKNARARRAREKANQQGSGQTDAAASSKRRK